MFFLPQYHRDPGFMLGLRDMVPQSPGIAAWGLMTGVAMVNSGMSVTEALAMTFLVFAGSAQLAATPLIMLGAPAWVILATAFCVNLRFVVFSLHLRGFLMHLPLSHRLGFGYLTADLSYVMFTKRYAHPGQTAEEKHAHVSYLAGSFFMNWITWMSASVLGILTAQAIPSAWGLGFAGTLCLIGVMCSLASTRLRLLSAATAALVALLAYHVPLRMNIVLAIAAAVGVSMVAESRMRTLQQQRKEPA
jgi:predicted branched-subunit amino acid permease